MTEEIKDAIREQTQKPAMQSKGVTGGLISTLTGIFALIAGLETGAGIEEIQEGAAMAKDGAVLMGVGIGSVVGGVRSIIGRIKAQGKIAGVF